MSIPPLVLAPAEVAEEAAFCMVFLRLDWVAEGLLYCANHSKYLLIVREKI